MEEEDDQDIVAARMAVGWLGMICERPLELKSQLTIFVSGIYYSLDALTYWITIIIGCLKWVRLTYKASGVHPTILGLIILREARTKT
jgi:hypothetical protein